MRWQLVAELGQRKGQVIPITRAPFLIGRDAGCHLRPNAASVSGRHCELITRGGRLLVRCQTTNGTFVNGRRIDGEQELRPGDVLRVGPLELRIDAAVTIPAPTRRPQDEDAIGQMLLAMDEEETDSPDRTRPAPGANTTEEAALGTGDTRPAHPAAGTPAPASPQAGTNADTERSARAILSAYIRRPRHGPIVPPP
jgi:predicted component of type VI protein secretion system